MNRHAWRSWLLPLAGSGVLLAALVYVADFDAFRTLLERVPWTWLAGGMLLLQCEGVCTALRVNLLAAPHGNLFDAIVVTAWWVLGLALLPARLGEISGMHMLSRRLHVPAGAALNSLLIQRLFDGLLLLMLGSIAVAQQSALAGRASLIVILLVGAALVGLLIARLGWCFAVLAQLARRLRRRRLARVVLRAALNGRRAARLAMGPRQLAALALVSLLKWLFNLAALALLIAALVPLLPWVATSVAILFNLAAVIPLQTVGGIGIGEVTFTAALGWYGFDLAVAASAALLLRALVIAAPVLFWALVMLLEIGAKYFHPRARMLS